MIPLIEHALLTTDLEAGGFNLLNVADLVPLPTNIVGTNDPRLSDPREPLINSVTNESVADDAAIVQSKLSLDGEIPTTWFGTTNTTAARGDLAEYLSNKGQPGGYAGLDGGGKVPAGNLPTEIGTGTVTSVGLTMPGHFSVSNSPVTGADTLDVIWATIAPLAWFGNKAGFPAAPQFYTDELPPELIPALDCSIVTTGFFDAALLPEAVGVGGSHAPGAVPDPGASGDVTDYLARDMTYKSVPVLDLAYQPKVEDVTITPSGNITGAQTIVLSTATPGVTFFYSLTSDSADFVEWPAIGYISLDPSAQMWVYAAKQGYNNSDIETYTNPNP